MRWLLVLCVCGLLGCDDEIRTALYADGSEWEPVVPFSPGRIAPRDMDDRQWATFVAQQNIQASGNGSTPLTFTPTWTGFSVDPAGDLSYMDFGAIVAIWSETSMQGTSDSTDMFFSNLPEAIRPSGSRATEATLLADNSGAAQGHAVVASNGTVQFYLSTVADDGAGNLYVRPIIGAFHNTGTKGLTTGWLIMYAK